MDQMGEKVAGLALLAPPAVGSLISLIELRLQSLDGERVSVTETTAMCVMSSAVISMRAVVAPTGNPDAQSGQTTE